jgi:hypothetical protein
MEGRKMKLNTSAFLALAIMIGLAPAIQSAGPYSHVSYVRTANIGIGASAEAVDFTSLASFGTQPRLVHVCVENEDTDSGDDLLFQFVSTSSVSASELTTPVDATLGNVVRLKASYLPWCDDLFGSGLIWQSDGPNLVNGTAIVSW